VAQCTAAGSYHRTTTTTTSKRASAIIRVAMWGGDGGGIGWGIVGNRQLLLALKQVVHVIVVDL
jgi:hypothetical protein